MRTTFSMTAFVVLVTALLSGCGGNGPADDTSKAKGEHTHSHEGDDALVWVEEGIEHEGYELALGHHGEHLHAASFVEPAVSVTRDGVPVADAKVFNSLVSADSMEVIREEVATVYEPETEEEPAHYAQGKLHLPKGSNQYIIRFRIELPEVEEDFTRDIKVEVEE